MMSAPLISIIIPVYNVESYLRQCLDSVISQTYTHWECLLVDDGSKDSSGDICDEYAQKDSRFKVFHKENGGVSSARNAGLDNAKGEYICFIDSDDSIIPTYLADFGDELCCDLYVQGATFIQNNNRQFYSFDKETTTDLKTISEIIYKIMPCSPEGYSLRAPWAKLYKRTLIGDIRFDTDVSFAEDYLFNVTVYQNLKSLHVSSGCGYLYIRDNSFLSYKKYKPSDYVRWFDNIQKTIYDLSVYLDNSDLYRTLTEYRINYLARAYMLNDSLYSFEEQIFICKYIQVFINRRENKSFTYSKTCQVIKHVPINAISYRIIKIYSKVLSFGKSYKTKIMRFIQKKI